MTGVYSVYNDPPGLETSVVLHCSMAPQSCHIQTSDLLHHTALWLVATTSNTVLWLAEICEGVLWPESDLINWPHFLDVRIKFILGRDIDRVTLRLLKIFLPWPWKIKKSLIKFSMLEMIILERTCLVKPIHYIMKINLVAVDHHQLSAWWWWDVSEAQLCQL